MNPETEFRPLPVEFTRDGYQYRQVRREGLLAIYSQRKGGATYSYEVIIIQQRPAEKIVAREYPPRETMPSPEQWGTSGWTCLTLADAQKRFETLLQTPQISGEHL